MEEKEAIDNLSNAAMVLYKVIRSNFLPADLEIEVCNVRYDLLNLVGKLKETAPLEEVCQCP